MNLLQLDHHSLWAQVLVPIPTLLEGSVSSSNEGCLSPERGDRDLDRVVGAQGRRPSQSCRPMP